MGAWIGPGLNVVGLGSRYIILLCLLLCMSEIICSRKLK